MFVLSKARRNATRIKKKKKKTRPRTSKYHLSPVIVMHITEKSGASRLEECGDDHRSKKILI